MQKKNERDGPRVYKKKNGSAGGLVGTESLELYPKTGTWATAASPAAAESCDAANMPRKLERIKG